ncbi:peptidoglycan D,D-transpeptidase FtsI family protein [Acuticoccus yangtzensis]|uniref:peptidoglycan D,D-transpeptidase FtsI family protein n=1 Tax=Acuticoccus yangtzensis TaxID=1443441 RepID=UPI000949760C|nr:penicillin-binding protein 2 [Acuticoccus yangtzensis]ORE96661.1 beta-lactamasese domain:ATP/GTP-binding site motif A [Stappia sp. 22II-S9-Z10]
MRRNTVRNEGARGRIGLLLVACVAIFGVISGRLVLLASAPAVAGAFYAGSPQDDVQAARPDIIDRNGEVLATDLATASLYAEPRNIVDVDEAVELLTRELPELDPVKLRRDLSTDRGFIWLQREVSGLKREAIHNLGIPGIGFLTETKRFYPGGSTVGHIVGHVNIDNAGIAGLEKTIDGGGLSALQSAGLARKGRDLSPVEVTIDLRVQHAVRDELSRAIERYRALAAIGIILDAKTLEVVAMTSLPDYDPNEPAQALEDIRMNRAMAGVYEMGSVFKTFTLAMGLDTGAITPASQLDARGKLQIGRHAIGDFHGKNRVLTAAEVFQYSSNIGSARIALKVGAQRVEEYYRAFGFLDRLDTELPEAAKPLTPSRWPQITLATTSFGHGISVTPMHVAAAAAAVVNGGIYANPTFYPRSEAEMMRIGRRVLSPQTSKQMRDLFYLNGNEGSGRSALVPGYNVGGKTGTAEKVVGGRYAENKRFNSYLAAFPMDDPQYIVLVVIDEPKPEEGKHYATAGWNAAPTVANIISRVGPMLHVEPRFPNDDAIERAITVAYQE